MYYIEISEIWKKKSKKLYLFSLPYLHHVASLKYQFNPISTKYFSFMGKLICIKHNNYGEGFGNYRKVWNWHINGLKQRLCPYHILSHLFCAIYSLFLTFSISFFKHIYIIIFIKYIYLHLCHINFDLW